MMGWHIHIFGWTSIFIWLSVVCMFESYNSRKVLMVRGRVVDVQEGFGVEQGKVKPITCIFLVSNQFKGSRGYVVVGFYKASIDRGGFYEFRLWDRPNSVGYNRLLGFELVESDEEKLVSGGRIE